jgi:ATP-binding cassette subfamily C protein
MRIKPYGSNIGFTKAQGNMLVGIKTLWVLFEKKERRSMVFLLIMILLLALVEVIGVSSVLPFLSVAATPEVVESNKYLQLVKTALGFQQTSTFLGFLGVSAALLIIFQNAFHAFVIAMKTRFSHRTGSNMSCRLLGNYLYRPYVFFLNENSSNLSKNVLGEAQHVVSGYLTPFLESITDIVVGISIVAVLIAVNPMAAFIGAGTVGIIYGSMFLVVKRSLVSFGRKRMDTNKDRYKAAMESLAGIKDVKLLGKEAYFLERFFATSRIMINATIKIEVIGKIPNYILNAVITGGGVLVLTALLVLSDDFSRFVPLIGVYAMAGTRLLPRFRELFAHISKMRAYQAVVELMLEQLQNTSGMEGKSRSYLDVKPLQFRNELVLESIGFTYPSGIDKVIKDQTFAIKHNTTVGLVGTTGCGKTTLVDLILGLLRPQSGNIVIDGIPLTEDNLREWQANLGYVPQSIYLSDDSVAANIAFGVPEHLRDMEAVKKAAVTANLAHFIETELSDGYDTSVKERGLRLSGGQKQRLGIARALYSDPSVLVLDEATSALDGDTESVIMEAIDRLGGQKTIIIIAHRLTTLIHADVIHVMEQGRITDSGTYHELMKKNLQFKRMSRVEG